MRTERWRAVGCVIALALVGACADDGSDAASSEAQIIDHTEQALSRCGYPPRRPWPSGCHFTCVCEGPVNGPFGEDIDDYACTGAPGDRECHLRPRPDCAFDLICE